MKTTYFSKYLTDFMTKYLTSERGMRSNTISSYRDTFLLLIGWIEKVKQLKIEKLTLGNINREMIIDFLDWLQSERKNSDSTRNLRLAAIRTFYKYLKYIDIDHLYETQRILSIKNKKSFKESIDYLSEAQIKLLFAQIDTNTNAGRRDLTLLSLMYDSAARVQEVVDLTPAMFRLDTNPIVKIIGKGNKARLVPLLKSQVHNLKNYIKDNKLDDPSKNCAPLFFNRRGEKFTPKGVNYILKKYYRMSKAGGELSPTDQISCHWLRHSRAMHLLAQGMNIVYIRDILGHSSVLTTEIYAKADSSQKRAALEKSYSNLNPNSEAAWIKNDGLISWLKKF